MLKTTEQKQAWMCGVLIDYLTENTDVQLKVYKNDYWMFSPNTGVHVIKGNRQRALIHWEGFKKNNEKN